MSNQLERASDESRMKLSHAEGGTKSQMSMMAGRVRETVDDVKAMMSSWQSSVTQERERTEERVMDMIEKHNVAKKQMYVSTI